MNRGKFLLIILMMIFLQAASYADYFTPQEVINYHENAIIQWDAAQQALKDNPLDENEFVLDIGSGDGKITALIAQQLVQGTVIGIDASNNMIAFAKAKYSYPNLLFEVEDINQISYQDKFDTIVSFFCLHWLDNQPTILKKIYNALMPEGKIIIVVPAREANDFVNLIYDLSKTEKWNPYFKKSVTTRVTYTLDEYEVILKSVGFTHIDVELKTLESLFSREELDWWLHPIVSKNLPEAEQPLFIEELLDKMTSSQGWIDSEGKIHIFSKNLQVTAYK